MALGTTWPAQKLRLLLFKVHTWVGLNVFLFLTIIMATGTVLVFTPEIEAYSNVRTYAPGPSGDSLVSFGTVYDSIQAEYPDVAINILRRTIKGEWIGDHTAVRTNWGENLKVWTDPRDGGVLGITTEPSIHSLLRVFHDSLFTGHWAGTLLVTSLSFVLVLSLVTGLWSYRRFWRGFFRLPHIGQGGRNWWSSFHKLMGLWLVPFLIVMILTGVFYFISHLGVLPKHQAGGQNTAVERTTPLPPGFNGAALDRAAEAAVRALPELSLTVIVLPSKPEGGIVFIGMEGNSPFTLAGVSTVTVDPTDFGVLATSRPGDAGITERLKGLAEALHHGTWAGNASRVLWFVFGAMATALAVSGAAIYATRAARLPRFNQAGNRPGALRRTWTGMFMVKWALIPLLLAAGAVGWYRFGPTSERWVFVPPAEKGATPANLRLKGNLRERGEYTLRLRVKDPRVRAASLRIDGTFERQIALSPRGDAMVGELTVPVSFGNNTVAVSLIGNGAVQERYVWRLGKAL